MGLVVAEDRRARPGLHDTFGDDSLLGGLVGVYLQRYTQAGTARTQVQAVHQATQGVGTEIDRRGLDETQHQHRHRPECRHGARLLGVGLEQPSGRFLNPGSVGEAKTSRDQAVMR